MMYKHNEQPWRGGGSGGIHLNDLMKALVLSLMLILGLGLGPRCQNAAMRVLRGTCERSNDMTREACPPWLARRRVLLGSSMSTGASMASATGGIGEPKEAEEEDAPRLHATFVLAWRSAQGQEAVLDSAIERAAMITVAHAAMIHALPSAAHPSASALPTPAEGRGDKNGKETPGGASAQQRWGTHWDADVASLADEQVEKRLPRCQLLWQKCRAVKHTRRSSTLAAEVC
eukprot:TRINITY_DN9920_c0_g2_i1.p1 TRINITY_DN9920_c0_g2~~TRINITY_DN9920_c0_g2_i1.p1  ORF type:complete len:231 (-),score=31.71 TRINITY_DN9920_c0_g2_i1:551-1243(-)